MNLAEQIVEELDLWRINDSDEIKGIIDKVIVNNPKEVNRYKAGEERLFGFFVGSAMKLTNGKANAEMLNKILKERLR